ncbi:MAG TPA: hypothetical protein VK541_14560 [Pedobacter sp.]|uniref:hypothetical protein n=1 Tax=Pedobacter sp. TaxID=1411316 RepID=UPI002B8CBBCD|nr:hypothetical protein [Pedobacter sp.]HMI03702.1 hypothetical protein [Pedobacter sp.]
MKPTLLLSLLLLFTISLHAQTQSPDVFLKKVNDAKAVFVPSANAEPVPVVKNRLAHYDYAIKLKGKNVEVRYIIWPFTEKAYAIYNNREKKEGDSVLHPDKLLASLRRIYLTALPEIQPTRERYNCRNSTVGV